MSQLCPSIARGSRRAHRTLGLALALGLPLFAAAAEAQIRTVLVSPVPGNPTASGAALVAALAGITSPSATNPFLLKVEPGIYDIGSTSLAMRPWVDIEGSGIDITTIQGTVNGAGLNAGTINGADHTELRGLTVVATGTQGTPQVIAMYNPAANPRLYRVRFVASGGAAWGLRNATSAPKIEECEFDVTGTGTNAVTYGIVFSSSNGMASTRSSILRSKIHSTGTGQNFGIYLAEAQIVTEIRDSTIEVHGGTTTHGIFADSSGWQGNENLNIRDTEINSFGASSRSYGIEFEFFVSIYLTIQDSKVWAHLATTNNYGILHSGGSSSVNIQGSSILGATQVIDVVGSLFVATSSLSGGPTTGSIWAGCAGVWDESAVFYANTCPP